MAWISGYHNMTGHPMRIVRTVIGCREFQIVALARPHRMCDSLKYPRVNVQFPQTIGSVKQKHAHHPTDRIHFSIQQ